MPNDEENKKLWMVGLAFLGLLVVGYTVFGGGAAEEKQKTASACKCTSGTKCNRVEKYIHACLNRDSK